MAERLDKVLLARNPDFSRSRIEGLVKAGFVTVNGVPGSSSTRRPAMARARS